MQELHLHIVAMQHKDGGLYKMSTLTGLISSGGGGGFNPKYKQVYAFQQSTTWSPPQNCKAIVTVIGGGGSGAHGQDHSATGGGAGGLAQSAEITLSASTTYTVTCGAGGAGANAANGYAGGNSSFSGSGVTTLTGNGGGAGLRNSTTGGAGGTASGGSLNYTGGAGSSGLYASHHFGGGGGAVNITGTAYSAKSHNYEGQGIGGAGTGDSGAFVNAFGSSGWGGDAATDNVLDFLDWSQVSTNDRYTARTINTGVTTTASTYAIMPPAAMGCGGDGMATYGTGYYGFLKAQNGGMFAGGGGIVFATNNSSVAGSFLAGHGGAFGGGGGGSCTYNASSSRSGSGRGGDGGVFIAITEWL
jgi:hypothetical protein